MKPKKDEAREDKRSHRLDGPNLLTRQMLEVEGLILSHVYAVWCVKALCTRKMYQETKA